MLLSILSNARNYCMLPFLKLSKLALFLRFLGSLYFPQNAVFPWCFSLWLKEVKLYVNKLKFLKLKVAALRRKLPLETLCERKCKRNYEDEKFAQVEIVTWRRSGLQKHWAEGKLNSFNFKLNNIPHKGVQKVQKKKKNQGADCTLHSSVLTCILFYNRYLKG